MRRDVPDSARLPQRAREALLHSRFPAPRHVEPTFSHAIARRGRYAVGDSPPPHDVNPDRRVAPESERVKLVFGVCDIAALATLCELTRVAGAGRLGNPIGAELSPRTQANSLKRRRCVWQAGSLAGRGRASSTVVTSRRRNELCLIFCARSARAVAR